MKAPAHAPRARAAVRRALPAFLATTLAFPILAHAAPPKDNGGTAAKPASHSASPATKPASSAPVRSATAASNAKPQGSKSASHQTGEKSAATTSASKSQSATKSPSASKSQSAAKSPNAPTPQSTSNPPGGSKSPSAPLAQSASSSSASHAPKATPKSATAHAPAPTPSRDAKKTASPDKRSDAKRHAAKGTAPQPDDAAIAKAAATPQAAPPADAAGRDKATSNPNTTKFAALPAPDPIPLPGVNDVVGVEPSGAAAQDAAVTAAKSRPDQPSTRGSKTTGASRDSASPATSQSHAPTYVQATQRPAPVDQGGGDVQWVRHTVIPGERLVTIAARYDTTAIAIAAANDLSERPALHVGDSLWIPARVVPAPRRRIEHVVQDGEDWLAVASKHGVPVVHLRRWNLAHPPKLEAGTRLRLWVTHDLEDEASELAVPSLQGSSWVPLAIEQGGRSVGLAHRGRLEHGVPLPEYPEIWHVRRPDEAFGSTRTLELLQRALIAFKGASGYSAPLSIGAISRKEGGRLRPHASHQSGRDIDIRLPTRVVEAAPTKSKRSTRASKSTDEKAAPEIDWTATWILVRELMLTGQVEFIFLDHALQKQLAEAARKAGEPEDRIHAWIQWPASAREGRAPIRHSPGHEQHLHVRFRCGPNDIDCG